MPRGSWRAALNCTARRRKPRVDGVKPIIAGQDWQEASNGEARARFHRTCHAEWRTEREAAARQALGLEG